MQNLSFDNLAHLEDSLFFTLQLISIYGENCSQVTVKNDPKAVKNDNQFRICMRM